MYSPRVIEAELDKVSKLLNHRIVRPTADRIAELTSTIQGLKDPETNNLRRALTSEEAKFITTVQLLSRYDFRFWCENFVQIDLDAVSGGGLGLLKLWESQLRVLDILARREEECYDLAAKGKVCDGLRIADHKGGRQVGHTRLSRALIMHRLTLWKHTRGMGGSVDEPKVLDLYDIDKMIWRNLPWFLRPGLDSNMGSFDVKGEHIYWSTLGSRILYQHGQQRSGLGQGKQFDVAHVTELASFVGPAWFQLEHNFLPTLPQNIKYPFTLCMFETTAQFIGNPWHDFSERVRLGKVTGWTYCFIPWYSEPSKYRRVPPDDWSPLDVTLKHAKVVEETSPEYVGKVVKLDREHLYWYETERQNYADRGQLNVFLTNFSATPAESFQHRIQGAFSPELIEQISLTCSWGQPFLLDRTPMGQEVASEPA